MYILSVCLYQIMHASIVFGARAPNTVSFALCIASEQKILDNSDITPGQFTVPTGQDMYLISYFHYLPSV